MSVLFFFYVLSVVVMLGFTVIFYRLSPYEGTITSYRLPAWEKVLFGIMLCYPFLSLFILAGTNHVYDILMADKQLYHVTYMISCVSHVFLAVMASVICYKLYHQSFWYRLLLVLNILAGGIYLAGIANALAMK